MSFETSALMLAWIAITLLAFAVAGILRQLALIRAGRPSDMPLGPPLGSQVSIGNGIALRFPDKSAVLLFADTSCAGCEQLMPRLSEFSRSEQGLEFVALFRTESLALDSGHLQVLEHQSKTFEELHIPVTPFGVTLSSSGAVVDAAPLGSISRLEQFVSRAKERSSAR